MNWILSLCLGGIETFIIFYYFQCYLFRNRKYTTTFIIITCSLLTIFSSIINMYFPIAILNLSISILTIATLNIFFKGTIIRRILISAIYIIFSIMIEFIVVFVIGNLFGINEIIENSQSALTYIAVIFTELIKLDIVFFLNKYKNRKGYLSNNYYLYLSFIPLLSIVILICFYYEQLEISHINYAYCYLFLFSVLIINLIFYLIYQKMEDLYVEKLKNNDIMQNLKYKESYYSQLELHQQEIRMLRHDMKNQLMAIRGYFDDKNYELAESELETIIHDILERENTSYTKNPSLNAVLNYKNNEIRKKNIDSTFEVNMPESINMSGRNIGILVGNILDNAIEACDKCISDRFIKLILYYYNHSIVLYCENSIDGKNKSLTTKKEDKLNHGLGIKSIEKIIQAYNGTMESMFTDKSFIISINLWNI